jgi:hypothetical protein
MPDLGGSFDVPVSQKASGEIIVYGWTMCRIVINKQVYETLMEMTCTRSGDMGSGKATIKFDDYDKATYGAINEGDEVEIYLSEETPMTYPNKVWGGYVENPNFDATGVYTSTIAAKEYTQKLLENFTPNSAVPNQNSFTAVEPGVAIKALMAAFQVDFTTENVLVGTTSLLTADFLNKSLFACLTEICNTYGYVFYVDLNKVLTVRKKETVVPTPATDYLTYGENIISLKEEKNKELLCNSVIVFGSGAGVVSNSGVALEDAASIAEYGRAAKRITISSLTTSADCDNYAAAYLAAQKDPLLQKKSKSYFVAHSEPLQYIPISAPLLDVDGEFQIREIKHTFNRSGIFTEMTLGTKISDLTMSLGQLMSRISATEIKAFS